MRFDLDIKDDAALDRFDGLRHRSENLRPVLTTIGNIIDAGIRRQFDSQGTYLGDQWDPLSRETIERKARQGYSPQVLRATGALEAAIKGGRGHVKRVAKTQLRVGTSYYVARFHQKRRKLIGVSKIDRRRILDRIRLHIINIR